MFVNKTFGNKNLNGNIKRIVLETYHIHVVTLCPLRNFDAFLLSADFFSNNFFEKFFQEYHLSVKQIGSRSSPTFCRA